MKSRGSSAAVLTLIQTTGTKHVPMGPDTVPQEGAWGRLPPGSCRSYQVLSGRSAQVTGTRPSCLACTRQVQQTFLLREGRHFQPAGHVGQAAPSQPRCGARTKCTDSGADCSCHSICWRVSAIDPKTNHLVCRQHTHWPWALGALTPTHCSPSEMVCQTLSMVGSGWGSKALGGKTSRQPPGESQLAHVKCIPGRYSLAYFQARPV